MILKKCFKGGEGMHISCIKNNKIIYYLCMILIGFVSELEIPYQSMMQKVLWTFLAVVGIFIFLYQFKNKDYRKLFVVLNLNHLPFILSFIFTFFLLIKKDPLTIIPQAFTTCGYIIVDVLAAYTLVTVFKKDVISLLCSSIFFSYFLGAITSIYRIGLNTFIIDFFNQIPRFIALMEKHDIGVAVVPLLLYYIYQKWYLLESLSKKDSYRILGLIFILLMCGKRSAELSIIVAIMTLFLLKTICTTPKRKYMLLTLCLIGCFAYVVIIKLGILTELCQMLGIDTKGRIHVYDWFNSKYSLSADYIGRGFQYVHRYMRLGLGDWMVNHFGYLHNSILQIYIENGFIGFFMWFGHIIYVCYYAIKKEYGMMKSDFYIILLFSMIATFAVDNTLTYPLYLLTMFSVQGMIYFNNHVESKQNKVETEDEQCLLNQS